MFRNRLICVTVIQVGVAHASGAQRHTSCRPYSSSSDNSGTGGILWHTAILNVVLCVRERRLPFADDKKERHLPNGCGATGEFEFISHIGLFRILFIISQYAFDIVCLVVAL